MWTVKDPPAVLQTIRNLVNRELNSQVSLRQLVMSGSKHTSSSQHCLLIQAPPTVTLHFSRRPPYILARKMEANRVKNRQGDCFLRPWTALCFQNFIFLAWHLLCCLFYLSLFCLWSNVLLLFEPKWCRHKAIQQWIKLIKWNNIYS